MTSSLLNLANTLTEVICRIKCKHEYDKKKMQNIWN